jgi:hypothetical protein
MNRVRVALFSNRSGAEPVWELLLHAGIPAEIHNESWLTRLWFVSTARAGVCVDVPVRFAETAEEILLVRNTPEGALRGAIRCPECGSLRVDYPQMAQKSILANIFVGLLAGVGLVEKDYYCEHCHCMWPKSSLDRPAPGNGSARAGKHIEGTE